MTTLLLLSIIVLSVASAVALFLLPVRSKRGFLQAGELPVRRSHWLANLLILCFSLCSPMARRSHPLWIDFARSSLCHRVRRKEVFQTTNGKGRDRSACPTPMTVFTSGASCKKALYQKHQDNHLIPSVYTNGMITLPYLLLKAFPGQMDDRGTSLENSGLGGELGLHSHRSDRTTVRELVVDFFAACLAGVAHSYYNRTLAGYYDTDMFSITVPAFAFFFLLAASRRESVGYLVAAAMFLCEQVFLRFDPSHYLAMCLVFIFIALGIFMLEALDGVVGKERESSSSNFFFMLLGLPSLRFTCIVS